MVSVGTPRPTHGTRSNETRHGSNATTNGGYVVGPGSVCRAGGYTVVDTSPLVALPGWVAEVLAPKAQRVQVLVRREYGDAYVRAVLTGEAERIRTASPGSRNSTLNLAAMVSI